MNKLSGVLLAALLLVAFSSNGQNFSRTSLPFAYPEVATRSLRSVTDQHLQNTLLVEIGKNDHWKALVNQQKMAVGLVDLRDPYNVKFAQVNGDQMMYAASLPKIAILLTAMDAMEKKELKESPEIWKDLRLMISRSDNQASTRMIDRLGYEKIASVLTDPQYQLYDEDFGGGLWVGKRYASQGRRYPDPIKGLSHAATASQVCRFYYLMVQGRLVSPKRSKQMLEMMQDPELHHKFVNTLERIAPKAKLFRKSGSWKTYHSDSILVWGPDRRYILVALIDDQGGEQICRQLVSTVEEVLGKDRASRLSSTK